MVKGIALLVFGVGAVPGFSQSPTFDAASIKPSTVGIDSSSWNSRPGYLVMKNQTLQRLVAIAYGFSDEQRALGGPKWVGSDRFDIEARAIGPAKDPELLLMLQKLLAERFQLAVHRETKSGSGFSLVPIKSGLKIQPDETAGKQVSNNRRGRIVAQRISMAKLAEALTGLLGASVVDMTGAKSVYSFTLEWTPDSPNRAGSDGLPASTPAGPSLEDVLASQLGLKLENKRLAIDVIVIDRAEKPTEN
jgi:uncharacterized protein (TIGR03435 family)